MHSAHIYSECINIYLWPLRFITLLQYHHTMIMMITGAYTYQHRHLQVEDQYFFITSQNECISEAGFSVFFPYLSFFLYKRVIKSASVILGKAIRPCPSIHLILSACLFLLFHSFACFSNKEEDLSWPKQKKKSIGLTQLFNRISILVSSYTLL